MPYFNQLPLVSYTDLETGNNTIALTNILTRSSFLKDIMNNTAVWYEYQVKDNETPEMIADKLYDDPNRHWIVLMFNQIMDPYYSFPMSSPVLNTYITNKYVNPYALHHYEQKTVYEVFLNSLPQYSNEVITTLSALQQNMTTGLLETTPFLPAIGASLEADAYTEYFGSGITINVTITNYAISNYTYEELENEKRRTIKLLDKKYVISVENEFRRLMRDGN